MIHGRPQETSGHPLNHVFIDELGHDGDGHGGRGGAQNILDLRILKSNDVLSIDFTDEVLCQQTVTGSRALLDQRGYFTRLVDEAHVT